MDKQLLLDALTVLVEEQAAHYLRGDEFTNLDSIIHRLAQRLKEPELNPVAWVPCGDIDHSPADQAPNWQRVETNQAQVKWLIGECRIRMRPLYLGPFTESVNGQE